VQTSPLSYLKQQAYRYRLEQARNNTAQSEIRAVALPERPPDIVDWAETHFYIIETGKPIRLAPHQKIILRIMTETVQRTDGLWAFRWTTWLYSTIKKSGKTTISAIVGRWAAETWGPYQEIYNLGNKLKQAKERAFRKIRQSIELGPPAARNQWAIQETQLTHLPSGSIIQALPISDAGEAGGNQSVTIWTELWGFQYEEALRMWDEMQPVLTRPLSVRFVDTYAGYEGESDLLKSIWNLVLNDDGTLAAGVVRLHDDLPIYGVPEAGLIAYIDQGIAARRMSWQQGDIGAQYYTQQQASERLHNFLRLHHNLWVSSVNALVPAAMWDALTFKRSELPDDIPVWLAADASVRRDCCALTAITVISDIVLELNTWVWDWDGTGLGINYSETIIPGLKEALKRFNVMGVAYDEYMLHGHMVDLSRVYRVPFYPFPQGDKRVRADTKLLADIGNGKFRHSGNETVRTHVINSAAKDQMGGEAIRIVKRTASKAKLPGGETITAKPIDAIVAISMGGYYATNIWEEHRIVYENSVRVTVDY
jgi:hypothetical protein